MKIPKIKKLPSGAYNCRVRVNGTEYSITDFDKDKVYAQAVAYKKGIIKARRTPERITVREALYQYIDERSNILSPATVREYARCAANNLEPLHKIHVDSINRRTIQRFVNDFAADHSAKTVRNVYALLSAALVAAGVERETLAVRIPEARKPQLHTPTEREIRRVIAAVRGTPMELPVYLAAFGSLRRGEICALTRDDVTDAGVWVTKSIARTPDGRLVVKATKERSSDRHAYLPPAVVEMLKTIPQGERITTLSPNAISMRFFRMLKANGIAPFRFHDLRAYWATVAHAAGMSDFYIMRNGGWSTMETPRKHYLREVAELNAPAQNEAQKRFEKALFGDDFGDEN